MFILGIRNLKRNSIANLKITLDFFSDGLIDLNHALSEIQLDHIHDNVKPHFSSLDTLQPLGSGLPACHGVATGKAVLSSDVAEKMKESGQDIILIKQEINPEDIKGFFASNGVLTARGGMTSHAALVARGIDKCCVVGFSDLKIDNTNKLLRIKDKIIEEGQWLSLNGGSGKLYLGKATITHSDWRNSNELLVLSKMIELAIRFDILSNHNIGHCWLIRDFFLHKIPVLHYNFQKKYNNLISDNCMSFKQPSKRKINSYRKSLNILSYGDKKNYSLVLRGLIQTLTRLLSNSVGIGNHFQYFRPLFNPMETINKKDIDLISQLVGVEFYNINKYISFLIDISSIKILLEIDAYSDHDLWFLDNTNPEGESIVEKSYDISAYKLYVNEAVVDHESLLTFYNSLRKREYYWKWYEYRSTSYQEIQSFMTQIKKDRICNAQLNKYAHELGLLNKDNVTSVGNSLIN